MTSAASLRLYVSHRLLFYRCINLLHSVPQGDAPISPAANVFKPVKGKNLLNIAPQGQVRRA